MEETVLLRARILNGPTFMLVGIEILSFIAGRHYLPENGKYILTGLVLQLPLWLIWSYVSASSELKSILLLFVSSAIRVPLSFLGYEGPGHAISLGLFPLIIFYYIQYQRTLTAEEAEDA